MRHYNVRTKIDSSGKPVEIIFPYGPDAAKHRELEKKSFYSTGQMASVHLFGLDKFNAGQNLAVTITEGELDALSVYQMLGSKFPVLSVRSASSAKKDCAANRDWLNHFEKIYLCFDNDEPGQKAAKEVAALFGNSKVYNVKLTKYKDANELLQAGEGDTFRNIWYNSTRLLPDGILSSFSQFRDILNKDIGKSSVSYPYATLQSMTYGIRQGECTLFTALEGVGKTEIIRSIEYHILKTTDHNIGVIHLEENEKRTLEGFAGYELKQPCHLPDSFVTDIEKEEALKKAIGRDERVHLNVKWGSDDPDFFLDRVRFLATAADCKFIFLDHITMTVTGLHDADQTKILDYLSTNLAALTEQLNFGLVFVSHVNDDGLTRGSRNISKVAHTWIHLNRDHTSEDETTRNVTYLTIRKNRFAGRTGPAGKLLFDPNTFTVSEINGTLPV
jgi:twinkle protein